MPPLRELITGLAGRPGVTGAAVVSEEGLVVEAALPPGVDQDTLAALAVTAFRSMDSLGGAMHQSATADIVAEFVAATAILRRLPSGALLVVIASHQADLGELLHDLRRHGPVLAELA